MLYFSKKKAIHFDKPLIHYSQIQRTCGYVVALDSSRSCCLACCHDYPFQSYSADIPV